MPNDLSKGWLRPRVFIFYPSDVTDGYCLRSGEAEDEVRGLRFGRREIFFLALNNQIGKPRFSCLIGWSTLELLVSKSFS